MNSKKISKEQWEAIKNRDKNQDGAFFYALVTTKNVCRPSCSARNPNPKNVEIFYSVEAALSKGYKPCQRCRPDMMEWQGPKNELAQSIVKFIDSRYAEKLSSKALGHRFFVNECYLHRVFKEIMGMTVLEYQHRVRMDHAKRLLVEADVSVSAVGYEIGYNTLSHFSRTFKKMFDMSPLEYRAEYRGK